MQVRGGVVCFERKHLRTGRELLCFHSVLQFWHIHAWIYLAGTYRREDGFTSVNSAGKALVCLGYLLKAHVLEKLARGNIYGEFSLSAHKLSDV